MRTSKGSAMAVAGCERRVLGGVVVCEVGNVVLRAHPHSRWVCESCLSRERPTATAVTLLLAGAREDPLPAVWRKA